MTARLLTYLSGPSWLALVVRPLPLAHKGTASPSPRSSHRAGMPPHIPQRERTLPIIWGLHLCSSALHDLRCYHLPRGGSAALSTTSHPSSSWSFTQGSAIVPVAPGEITTKRSWVNCPALISLQELVEITKPRIPLTTSVPGPGTANAVTMAQQCE